MAATSTMQREISPVALGMLAAGGFIVLSAVIFLSPFVLSPYAIQNDVYMANLFIGPPVLVVGGVLVLIGLLVAHFQRRATAWGPALLLIVVAGGLLAVLYALAGGHYVSYGPPTSWPRYLNEPAMGLTVALSLAVFVAGWIWGWRMGRQHRPQTPGGTPART